MQWEEPIAVIQGDKDPVLKVGLSISETGNQKCSLSDPAPFRQLR